VWSDEQIYDLFDSLMRGYPIGSFLYWTVEPTSIGQYVFFGFIRDYHQRDAPHCPRLDLPGGAGVTAILDGQQRFTALNIGLRGSIAEKQPRKHWNSPDAFPKKELYVNLLRVPDDEESRSEYQFQFLTAHDAAAESNEGSHWFRVGDILDLDPGPGLHEYLVRHELGSNREAFRILYRLHSAVHTDLTINYYQEERQDLDRVLNIFVRMNTGGEPLSYSDLLLSTAVAQWRDVDARDAILGLVDEINDYGQRFRFSKDVVLKSGLVLTDISDIRFNVANFNSANMRRLEENWDKVAQAVRIAAALLANFGFSERTLRADSPIIPVALYIYRRGFDASFLSQQRFRSDRDVIRGWVVRSLLKPGIWGSGLDTLLANLRNVIKEHADDTFPVRELEAVMARSGKSLRFDDDELQDLVEARYGSPGAFAALTLLYPSIDSRTEVHVDHIFPSKLFRSSSLRRGGVESGAVDEFQRRSDCLPNLHLLDGPLNQSKGERLPVDWLASAFPDDAARGLYMAAHDMHDVPADLNGFPSFYDARRARLLARLRELLGQGGPSALSATSPP
jgi:hypothetical protein